ncbi:MAG: hypothetical protein LBE58_03115 [Comamonas sp.]|nr:hypothetical protein [Comamonas sp.]
MHAIIHSDGIDNTVLDAEKRSSNDIRITIGWRAVATNDGVDHHGCATFPVEPPTKTGGGLVVANGGVMNKNATVGAAVDAAPPNGTVIGNGAVTDDQFRGRVDRIILDTAAVAK